MSGTEILLYYILEIFRLSRLPAIDRYQLACLQHASMVIGYLASVPIMARTKRRRQFVVSAGLMGLSMAVLGTSLSLENVRGARTQLNTTRHSHSLPRLRTQVPQALMTFLPPLCVVLVTFFYGLGIGPICFALLGELFPIRAKAFCSGVVVATR